MPLNASAVRGGRRRSRYLALPVTTRCTAFALALVLVASSSQTASAGCCDDFWSCAAAVATGGLSCVVEGLIDTVNNLVNKVSALRNQINQMSSDTAHNAQQGVNDAADNMNSEAQQVMDDQAKAEGHAQQVMNEENPSGSIRSKTPAGEMPVNRSGAEISNSSSGASNQPSATVQPKGGASNTTARNANVQAPAGNSPKMTGATIAMAPALHPADPAELQEEMNAALQEVKKKRAESSQQQKNILNQAQKAKTQAANGVNAGLALAGELAVAPLDGLVNWLKDLVAHPDKIFDPTSIIDSEVDTITNDLSNTLDQVANKVTSDANNTMQSAQGDYDDIQKKRDREQEIANKMEALHRDRTQGALEALEKLVPLPRPNRSNIAMAAVSLPAGNARVVPFSAIMARFSANREKALAVPKQRIQDVKLNVGQLKAIRLQARNIHNALPQYQKTVSQHLDGYFAGKPAADVARQRDQLIAEARTHFAKDPRTRDAVVKLLTDEAGRRMAPARVRSSG
jgi:hypothetical protein